MAEPPAATSEVAGEPAAEVSDAAEAPETVQPALPLEPAPAEAAPPVPAAVDGALVLTLARPAATFTVARTAATIGRGPDNSIRLDDLSVSKKHARIAYRQGGYWLSDLASMGGTWVDGNRLAAPRRIAAGEVIDIGHCRLTVGFAPEEASVEAKKIVGASRRASRP
jgi:pSer/pThr/pTyr-binding forkhead associated (FHA) protein